VPNAWHNISFDEEHNDGFFGDRINATILYSGHYTMRYWCVVQDASPVPTGHKMAIAIFCNGEEIDGSYREGTFATKQVALHLSGEIHDYFPAWSNISYRYVGDDIDETIRTNGTWSFDDINAYATIMKDDSLIMEYNKTYYWYVNVTDTVTGASNNSDIFSYTTAQNFTDCFSGNLTVALEDAGALDYKAYIIGLLGLLGLLGYSYKRRRKRV